MGATDGGGDHDSPTTPTTPAVNGCGEEKIFVSVRLRPLNGKEISKNDVSDWECASDKTIVYKNANLAAQERSMYPSAYTFDRVFSCDCSTRQVYMDGAKQVALSVVSGINSSIFAYGQTSSGKTFTMTGITEYTLADIYLYVQQHKEREFHLKFSAMEIYNESVRDLLTSDNTPLRLLDDPERGTIVEKLTEETVRDWDHVMELLSICEGQRQIGETSLNETSSRSHQIIRLTIESSAREFSGRDNSSILMASVNFVDLAGSERASQSLSAGARLKEGCHINRSLLTLGTVIRKLSKGRNGHIPFRDSKLTRILQSSLGGNARTAIICTMSPARSHVEQSRNTLLFASCAKEVSTNAQVNIVMSDKALVRHLQRELIRLESELRTPGSSPMASMFSALLQEKDLRIEQLEKQVLDLIRDRDDARCQVQDLLCRVGDEGSSLIRLGSDNYPHLRVQRSPESEDNIPEMSIVQDPRSLENSVRTCGSNRYLDRHSEIISEENYIQIPGLQENCMHDGASPRLLIRNSRLSETDSCQGWDDVEERSNGTSPDLCKEVRCVETDDLCTKSYVDSSCFSPDDKIGIPELALFGNEDRGSQVSLSSVIKGAREVVTLTLTGGEEFITSPELNWKGEVVASSFREEKSVKDNSELLTPVHPNKRNKLTSIPRINATTENLSPWVDLPEDISSFKSWKLPKSKSCKESPLINMNSLMFEKVGNNENTTPNGSERDFTGRPQSFMKISTMDHDAIFGAISRKHSHSSLEVVAHNDVEVLEKIPTDEDNTIINTCVGGIEEMAGTEHEEQVAYSPANETEETNEEPTKSMKDVGVDPIEDCCSTPCWPTDFKRLQKDIVELWHACNVSLLHRTYFFLLFNGDPTDAIYMEVERRRLTFLKEAFARGNVIVEDGRSLTFSSSAKALRREREMLTRQMQRKLSRHDRESLFLRWGIELSSKYRRIQLVNLLWSTTDDMDHIADSAIIVAKLVGFLESAQAPKEMFGFNLAPRPARKSYSFKRSLVPLL